MKLFSRIFISFILQTSVLLIVLSFITIRIMQAHFHEQQVRHLNALTKYLSENIEVMYRAYSNKQFDQKIKLFVQDNTERITVIMADGTVYADSNLDPKKMENHKNRSEILAALRDGEGYSERFSNSVKKRMLYFAKKIELDGQPWVIRVSSYTDEYHTFLVQLWKDALQVVFGVIIIAIVSSIILSRSISRPISHLVSTAKKVSEGNFDVSFYPFPVYEIEQLNCGFQTMIERISFLVREQTEQQEALRKVIKHIREPLFVIDRKGKILVTNKALARFFKYEDVVHSYYWEKFRNKDLVDYIKAVLQGNYQKYRSIMVGESYYSCRVSKIHSANQYIFLLYDVTEMKKLELIKKEFVSNVSHELRTPLTSIKGFAETIKEEINDDLKYYIDVILRNTDRMIMMVSDLLSLSKLEQKQNKIVFEKINIFDIIKNAEATILPKLLEKGVAFKLNCAKNVTLEADAYKLEQVFINLVENAIRYTDTGEISISVSAHNHTIFIAITDTGIGIEKQHLSRLFERFYVVDKSRSKKVGGTGLGLSIVKHIMTLHNGTIEVQSKVGKGTTFTLTFPEEQDLWKYKNTKA